MQVTCLPHDAISSRKVNQLWMAQAAGRGLTWRLLPGREQPRPLNRRAPYGLTTRPGAPALLLTPCSEPQRTGHGGLASEDLASHVPRKSLHRAQVQTQGTGTPPAPGSQWREHRRIGGLVSKQPPAFDSLAALSPGVLGRTAL